MLAEQSQIPGISMAQWALVEEIRAVKWNNLDFPRIAREDFNLTGIEFVNTFFEVPTEGYLKKLKQNAVTYGVTMLLIMVDDEGDGCEATREDRKRFEINHRKWVDIAAYLGCHAIRANCRGREKVDKTEALKDPAFGTYPDWREPAPDFDNYAYLQKTLSRAKGMSYRNQPTEELTAKMISLSKDAGYSGWYGIESNGREEIRKGMELLEKYLQL